MSVQIVKINERTRKLELDYGALERLLLQEDVKDREVVVISIAGECRKGKSFLLNFFLKYLYKTFITRSLETDWLGDGCFEGFLSKRGLRPVTSGIHVWNEIFKHDFDDGLKVAIQIMDTQATFDKNTTARDSTITFSLSTLLSSVQIFNVMNQVQEDNLQHLEMFAGHGSLAAVTNTESKPFQTLLFLVRDWCNAEEFIFGIAGGQAYIDTEVLCMPRDQQSEHKLLRQHLQSCFEDINCFLMPPPGENVTSNSNFQGQLCDIRTEFLDNVKDLAPYLLAPENLRIKKINQHPVKAFELAIEFKKSFEALNGSKMPEMKTFYNIRAEIYNPKIFSECQKLYGRKMTRTSIAFAVIKTEDTELRNFHETVKNEALAFFDEKAMLESQSAEMLRPVLISFMNDSLQGLLRLHSIFGVVKSAGATGAIALATVLLQPYASSAAVLLGPIAEFLSSNPGSLVILTQLIRSFMSFYERNFTRERAIGAAVVPNNFWQNNHD